MNASAKLESISISQAVERCKKFNPEIASFFFLRRYRNVERYHDHRIANCYLCTYTLTVKRGLSLATTGKLAQLLGITAAVAAKFGFPLFFVAPEMFRAATQTSPPDEIDWETMKLPFESMTFVLPKGAAEFEGEEVAAIQMTRAFKGSYVVPKTSVVIELPDTILMFEFFGSARTRVHRYFLRPYLASNSFPIEIPLEDEPYAVAPTVDDAKLTDILTRVAFNLIYAMAARPELVTKAPRRIKVHKKSSSEIWEPRVIGEHFTIARPSADMGGTHASPRLHWRRGHFRRQRIGEMRMEHKIVWIEPCLVGMQNAEAIGC